MRMKVGCRYRAVSDEESRARGDRVVAWLRSYGEKRVNSRLIDERRTVPPYVANDLARQGVFGIQVEEKYGGIALRSREIARVLEQAAAIDLALATFVLVCLYPGVRPIATFATDSLKNELLPLLAGGRIYAGFAQTEPGAGTNFAGIATRAVAQPGGGWRVSGDKVWIGNSSWAGALTVVAQEVDASGKKRGSLVGLAVRPEQEGVTIGRELLSLGMRGVVQGELHFRDVFVPPEALLGEPGKGIEVAVDSMSWSRFAIAATSIGATKRAAQLMLRFGTRRQIATGRLIEHPVMRSYLGETAAQAAIAEGLLYRVAASLDAGEAVSVDLYAACKLMATEFAWLAADRLCAVLGSRGYDEANGAPQLLRDARVGRIFEGTSEALVAYLGSQALSARSDLAAFLREDLAAGPVADRLDAAVAALRARGGAAQQRTWQVALAGWAAMWALAAGVAAQDAERAPSAQAQRTSAWAAQRFAEACARAGEPGPRERSLFDAAAAEEVVASFAASIGDVDLTLAGEKRDFDPLLLREPGE
jgi:alkylation response protein AidB-like acyl-CoA dehydrogenase